MGESPNGRIVTSSFIRSVYTHNLKDDKLNSGGGVVN